MKNLSFFNDSFSINQTPSYILSLQLDSESYSYTIIDSIRNIFVAIKHQNFDESLKDKFYTDKVKSMFANDAFLKKNYKSVNFNFVNNKTTLVPFPLFDKKKLKNYFDFNHKLSQYEELHFNKLDKTGAYNIFAIPSEITTLLVNHFPEIRFYNQVSTFVENTVIKAQSLKLKLPLVQVNFNSKFFDIAVVISGKLTIFNSFTYDNVNDFIYHILNVYNLLDLKASNTYLNISGGIYKNSDFHDEMLRYFPEAKFAKLDSATGYMFNDISEHLFYNILNLHKCEL